MLPPIPSDLTLLAPWSAQTIRTDLTESRAQAQHICEEATATCAIATEIRQEAAQLRHNAQQIRAIHAQHLAAGVRRRQKGRAREEALLSQ
jgi:hypothetical protein